MARECSIGLFLCFCLGIDVPNHLKKHFHWEIKMVGNKMEDEGMKTENSNSSQALTPLFAHCSGRTAAFDCI
jgi:hypothetical protein